MPRTSLRRLLLILLAAAALYLIGNDRVGLWDRDEPRYAQTSKQMLLSDPPDWVVPRFLDQVRTAKPIFIYWCQAVSMRLFGPTPFAARMPSVLAMLATLTLLGVMLGRFIGWRRSVWTVFILATSALVIGTAKLCITDSVLLLWITLAQLCLCAIYHGARAWWVVLVMWLAVGLAGLTKGPVVLAVQVPTILALALLDVGRDWRSSAAWRRAIAWWRHIHPLIGLLIVVAVVGPWLLAIHFRAPHFLPQTLRHDVVRRSMVPLEGHQGPPGYYLLSIWITYLPWSLLLPTTLALAWRNRRLLPIRFALAAIIGPWLLVESVQTKLVHYLLPIFPPLAFLTADALVRCIRGQHRNLLRLRFRLGTVCWATAIVAIGAAPWLAPVFFDRLPPALFYTAAAVSVLCLAYALAVCLMLRAGRIAAGAAVMGSGMILAIAIFYGLYLPSARFLWLPQHIAHALAHLGATPEQPTVMVDYQEDSVPFYQGGTIRPAHAELLTAQHPERWPAWIVITRSLWNRLPWRINSQLDVAATLHGWDYAGGGKLVEVMIVRRRAPAAPATQASH